MKPGGDMAISLRIIRRARGKGKSNNKKYKYYGHFSPKYK
jgi:hypothetical protein